MSEGPGGPQGATAGGTLAMRMLSQQAMVASQMKRAANDKAIAQMLAAKKSGPPAARLGDEIQHKSFLGALAGAVLGAIVTIAEGCLIMAACATGPYALVLVPALMYASYKASDYVEEKQNQLESWINSFCDTDGAINTGSENVNINGKPAARAAVTLPPPPPPGAIPEIPQGEPSWGDIATDLLESAAEKAVPLAKAWGNAVITLTESNAGFMDRVSAGASLLFPAGPVLMEFATMVGGRGEIKKDVDFPEAGEDTALCDKENKPPRIRQAHPSVAPQWVTRTNHAVSDLTGRPLMLFNSEGKTVWRPGQTSLWGLALSLPADTGYPDPRGELDPEAAPGLLYAGQWQDVESGLCYNRFRYYEPETGMYLVSDPLGLQGGEQTYRYVPNPLRWIDPLGLNKGASLSKMMNSSSDLMGLRRQPQNFWRLYRGKDI